MPRKNRSVSLDDLPAPAQQPGVPAWMAKLRAAAQKHITENDIEAIVAKQVEKAKDGDQAALKFVFDQVLGGASFKGATFVQTTTHHHYGDQDPNAPTDAEPGTDDKVAAMAARVANGRPVFDDHDAERDLR